MKSFLCLCLLFISASLNAGALYKCEVDGRVNFTDQPCDGEVLKLKGLNSIPTVNAQYRYSSNQWFENSRGYQRALQASRQYQVPMLIYFEAEWCGYCRKLEQQLLNTYGGKQALKNIVKVRIRPDDGVKEKSLFKQMGATGYPTMFKLQNAGSTPQRVSMTSKVNNKWRTISAEKLQAMIDRWLG